MIKTYFICRWNGKAWRKVSIEFASHRDAMKSKEFFTGEIAVFNSRVCAKFGIV